MTRTRASGLLPALFNTALCALSVACTVVMLCSDLYPLVVLLASLALGAAIGTFLVDTVQAWRAWAHRGGET